MAEKRHKQEIRKDEEVRLAEKRHKQEKRKDEEVRLAEKRHKQEIRKDEEVRLAEKRHKQEKRKDEEIRLAEKRHKQEKRKDEEVRLAEKRHKQEKRKDEEVRLAEKRHKQEKRKDEEVRLAEKRYMQEKRKDEEFRLAEKRQKQEIRKDEEFRLAEKRHKQEKRKAEEFRNRENLLKKKNLHSIESMISEFHKSVEEGPLFICTCCDQLWYRQSVRLANVPVTVEEDLRTKCITGMKSVNDKEWICNTCFNTLKKNKMPVLSKANKVIFPELPECLQLTNLEERLVAARIPFMQLRELPRGGQFSIHGNVVNVPTNITSTVHLLPRHLSDENSIPLKLKR